MKPIKQQLQYDARDKFLFCLVLGWRTSESPAIVISVRRKSAANHARFAAETLVLCGTCAASCCLRRVHQKVIKQRQPKTMHARQHAGRHGHADAGSMNSQTVRMLQYKLPVLRIYFTQDYRHYWGNLCTLSSRKQYI